MWTAAVRRGAVRSEEKLIENRFPDAGNLAFSAVGFGCMGLSHGYGPATNTEAFLSGLNGRPITRAHVAAR